MSQARLLVIEDEPQVRRFLRASLRVQEYQLFEAATGREGLALATQYVPDLILLDLGLPDMDGLEVVRRLREWSSIPIVVVSARGQDRQKVDALDAGADDYLTKPFSLPELLARIRAMLRRAERASGPRLEGVVHCGPLAVNLDTRKVEVDGAEVHLTPLEYRLLAFLLKHAGRVVTQKQLLAEIWGPVGEDRSDSLRVVMTHLRRKLQKPTGGYRLFHTEAGVGYRLRCGEE